jgi:hypothetical protein
MPRASSRRSSSAERASARAPSRSSRARAAPRLAAVELLGDQPELQRQRDEPLLRAVVQVALDAPALGQPGLEQAPAGLLELLDAGAQLGLQALVLHRQRDGRADRAHQVGLVAQRASWTIAPIRRPSSSTSVGGTQRLALPRQGDRVAVAVHVLGAVGQPVRQPDRAVAERVGERLAQPALAQGP